jgi:hypothetical protein
MAFFRRAELFACLGALAFTGCVISDDDGETEASTSGNTMTTTMTTAGTADDDGGTATMGTMTTPGTGDDTAGTTAGDTAGDTAGTTAADTGPGGDATEACLAACEVGSGCEKLDPTECGALCVEAVGFAERDGCVDEFVSQQNCLAALDCTQYFDWLNEVGDPYPCAAEDEALFTCEDGGGDSGSSSGGADSSSSGG